MCLLFLNRKEEMAHFPPFHMFVQKFPEVVYTGKVPLFFLAQERPSPFPAVTPSPFQSGEWAVCLRQETRF